MTPSALPKFRTRLAIACQNGDEAVKSRDYLSIIADVVTIVGVSIVWFIGQPVVAALLGRHVSFGNFANGILFYFIWISMTAFIVILLEKLTFKEFKQKHYAKVTIYIGVFIALISVIANGFVPSKDLWANLFANEYLFPSSPNEVIKDIDLSFDRNDGRLKGTVNFNDVYKQIDACDYRIVSYSKYKDDSNYNIHRFLWREDGAYYNRTLVKINSNGSFLIPDFRSYENTVGNTLESIVVAVVTRLDDGLRTRYPTAISGKDAPELIEVGAFGKLWDK